MILPCSSTTILPAPEANDLPHPTGRNRNVGTYSSVQQHLPSLYGIGDMGLPDSATPERKAQAQQLKAYLQRIMPPAILPPLADAIRKLGDLRETDGLFAGGEILLQRVEIDAVEDEMLAKGSAQMPDTNRWRRQMLHGF